MVQATFYATRVMNLTAGNDAGSYSRKCQRNKEVYMADRTHERGLGSPNMSQKKKDDIHKAGGHAQPIEAKREGGRKGGARSRRTS
jgi:hypothetical protein